MSGSNRYDALRQTQHKIDEQRPAAPEKTPENTNAQDPETRLEQHTQNLQTQVDARRITGADMMHGVKKFDNAQISDPGYAAQLERAEAAKAEKLREAKELAAAAREHEAADKSQEKQLGD
jgi:hypothetical protein